jgi:solute carrier family 25 (peroxisomal adenine nucleotide transporter), member 17
VLTIVTLVPQVKSDDEGKYDGSMLRCIMHLVSKGGIAELFRGLVPSLWLVSNPVVQYFTYERLRIAAVLFRGGAAGGSVNALDSFLIGALAKMVATVVTFPLQLAQVQVYKTGRPMLQCLKDTVQANGATGIYKGMAPKLSQTCLNSALMFLFYEKLEVLIGAALLAGRAR